MKILIIDDEELDLFISKKLVSLEYAVEGFTTVKAATCWANENEFDVVLIDYYLGPNEDAHVALTELIKVKGKTFKAYVVSSYVDSSQVRALKSAGFNDVIFKPLTLEALKVKLS